MTSIHIYDPGDGPQLPELPPLPVAILMVGTHDLLAQAADLPQPTGITVQADQRANLEFPPDRASVRAVTRWALRFGAIVISTPCEFPDGPQTLCRADFDYYGIAVTVYAFIPAAPAGKDEEPVPHVNYPHLPGRLHDCPACQARCHCTSGDAQCVYDGQHNGLAAP